MPQDTQAPATISLSVYGTEHYGPIESRRSEQYTNSPEAHEAAQDFSLGSRLIALLEAEARKLDDVKTDRDAFTVRDVSTARFSSARSRLRCSRCRWMRIAQMSFGLNGAFWPTSLPLFHGTRVCRTS